MLKLGRVTGQLGGDFRWTGAAGSGGGWMSMEVHGHLCSGLGGQWV